MPKVNREPKPREIIAKNIKIMLVARGMKTKEIAKRLNVTPNAVGKWLRADTEMGVDTLGRIAHILNTTPTMLLTVPEEVAENCTRLVC